MSDALLRFKTRINGHFLLHLIPVCDIVLPLVVVFSFHCYARYHQLLTSISSAFEMETMAMNSSSNSTMMMTTATYSSSSFADDDDDGGGAAAELDSLLSTAFATIETGMSLYASLYPVSALWIGIRYQINQVDTSLISISPAAAAIRH